MRHEIPAPAVAALSYIDRASAKMDRLTADLPRLGPAQWGQLVQGAPVAYAIQLLLCPIILPKVGHAIGRCRAARWPQNANLLVRGRELAAG
jgi:hypothetical protein